MKTFTDKPPSRRNSSCSLGLGLAVFAASLLPLHAAQEDWPVAWRRGSLPGFEIYSDVPDARTRDILYQFSLVCRDADLLWPIPQAKTAAPRVIILSNDPPAIDGNFFEMRGSLTGSPFLSRDEPKMLLLNFRSRLRGHDDQYYSGARRLQGQYAGRFRELLGESVPPWVSQGVYKLIDGMCCGEEAIELPALTTDPTLRIRIRTNGSEASLKEALRTKAFLRLEELFSASKATLLNYGSSLVSRDGRHMLGPQHKDFWATMPSSTFMDEAYEFAHFCLFAENGKYRAAFMKFVYAACNGPLEEAGFETLFGADYDTMLLKLWRFTALASDQVYPLTAFTSKPGPVPTVVLQPATSEDIESLRATWAKAPVPPLPPISDPAPRSVGIPPPGLPTLPPLFSNEIVSPNSP